MEYLLTEEQYKDLKHYNEMFKHQAESLKELCNEEKADINIGFELGYTNKHLWECFIEMGDILGEVYGQRINSILEGLINKLTDIKVESAKPDSRRTGDYRIGIDAAITEISKLIKE